jgi:hypothetical protein
MASIFNTIERGFAPPTVISKQRDELLNLSGKYSDGTGPGDQPAAAASAPPIQTGLPLSNAPATVTASSPRDLAAANSLVDAPAPVAAGGYSSGGYSDGGLPPMVGIGDFGTREGYEAKSAREAGYDEWARRTIDNLPEEDPFAKKDWRQQLHEGQWFKHPRALELPSYWPVSKQQKAILYIMRNGG